LVAWNLNCLSLHPMKSRLKQSLASQLVMQAAPLQSNEAAHQSNPDAQLQQQAVNECLYSA
jgi:hypothetical protein